MKAKLTNDADPVVHVKQNRISEFPENTLGVIEEWDLNTGIVGTIVIRVGDNIVDMEYLLSGTPMNSIDWSKGKKWDLDTVKEWNANVYVKPLSKGSEITIMV